MSILGNVGNWFSKGDNLTGLGTTVGALGSIYGGVKQAQAAEAMIDLQNKEYEFNKSQVLSDNEDKKKQQAAYNRAYSSGVVAL